MNAVEVIYSRTWVTEGVVPLCPGTIANGADLSPRVARAHVGNHARVADIEVSVLVEGDQGLV